MELKERITLDMLTNDSVSVLKQKYLLVNGVEMQVGNNERSSFCNTEKDRKMLKKILQEEYYNAVVAVWGTSDNESEEV